MRRVRRQVGDRHPGADHRGLVADRVDAVQQRRQRVAVAHVDLVRARGCDRAGVVRLGDHQVDAHHLVAGGLQLRGHGPADEALGAGQQHLHGSW